MSTTSHAVAAGMLGAPSRRIRHLGCEMGLWNHGFDFPRFCAQLFHNTDFRGKSMLEIGCGKGLLCLWAALNGASETVGLEPLAEGAFDSSECHRDFRLMAQRLGLSQSTILPYTVQDYDGGENRFDIVLSVASINHLDEKSCIALRKSSEAVRAYQQVFRHIARMLKPGGKLIIMDAARRNFFGDLGLRNPLSPNIEWFKHQQPETWAALLRSCGLDRPSIAWAGGKLLRHIGIQRLPSALAYFGQSIFRLEMTRS